MGRKKVELIAAAVLVAIFLILAVRTIGSISGGGLKTKAAISGEKDLKSAPAAAVAGDDKIFLQQKDTAGKLGWLKDPFAMSAQLITGGDLSRITQPEQLKVAGIMFDKNDPKATYAILNDTVVKVGEKFGVLRIVDIKQDTVLVNINGKEYALKLWQEAR